VAIATKKKIHGWVDGGPVTDIDPNAVPFIVESGLVDFNLFVV
jgi:hypothetical protein